MLGGSVALLAAWLLEPRIRRHRVVLYADSTVASLSGVCAIASAAECLLVVRGVDDERSCREVLDPSSIGVSAARQAGQVGGGNANLPIRMRTRWASVLVGPGSASVKEIASRSDGSRRSMERRFAKLGLPAPRSLLLRARVAHVLDRLDAGNCTLSHTAQEFGWRDVRSLRKSLRKWSGG